MSATELPLKEGFSIAIEPRRDEVAVVPAGDLDLATADRLEHEVRELRSAGFTHVVVDLRDVAFVDSTGLRTLLTLSNEARRDGFSLTVIPGRPQVQRVFDVTRTHGLFDWRER